jgi:hypothetical protein
MVKTRKGSSSGSLPPERGVSVISTPPPPPLYVSPLLVQDKDVEFVLQDLSKGDSLDTYVPLWTHVSNFLCRVRVHTQESGKQGMVHNYRYLNSFCKKQTCTVHYLSFHLMPPASYVNTSGHTVQKPLQPGDYWTLTHGSPGQYQVVERTCAALPFGYTNATFIWTKVIKVFARDMRARGIHCIWFIDDCLLALSSRSLALLARKTVEDLFMHSGVTRAPEGYLVAHRLSQITWVWRFQQRQSPAGSRSPNGDVKRFRDQSRTSCVGPYRKDQTCSIGSPTIIPRKVSSIGGACNQGLLRLRDLHDRHDLWKPLSTLDRATLRDLQWWVDFHYSSPTNGVTL